MPITKPSFKLEIDIISENRNLKILDSQLWNEMIEYMQHQNPNHI